MNQSGPVETAYVRAPRNICEKDDRRIDLVVLELDRLRVEVAGLQETRWFGSGVYRVGDSVVLSSGRPLPSDGGGYQRGEGVALVLRGRGVATWRAGGSRWNAVSPQILTS